MISSLVTDANGAAINPNCSEVNSTGYSEFDEPISAREKYYSLVWCILIIIKGINPVTVPEQ